MFVSKCLQGVNVHELDICLINMSIEVQIIITFEIIYILVIFYSCFSTFQVFVFSL